MTEPWTSEEIYCGVVQALADSQGKDAHEITPQTLIIEDLGIDSLDFLHIAFVLRQKFNITVRTHDFPMKAQRTYTVELLCRYVEFRLIDRLSEEEARTHELIH